MKSELCIECNKRPVRGNNFLCFECKRREAQRDVEAIEDKQERDFKFDLREAAQDIPRLRGFLR
jgi:hypothetical protein